MSARQYVVAKFREGDKRGYTYHNDGPPVALDDVVRVADRSGVGWLKVFVVDVHYDQPHYETKPILGPHVEDVATEAPEPVARPVPGTVDFTRDIEL